MLRIVTRTLCCVVLLVAIAHSWRSSVCAVRGRRADRESALRTPVRDVPRIRRRGRRRTAAQPGEAGERAG